VVAVALTCGSYPAAEDAVQEALVRAWQREHRGAPIDSLEAWVATVALNLSRSGIRRAIVERKVKHRLATDVPASAAAAGDTVDLERALARLPRRQRETAVLRYLLEMDTREVAAVLKVSEGTVKSQLARARANLAADLGVHEALEEDHAGPRR
jgi:RNA polymerase sigma-70 factor (ECF subfamily)